MAAGKEQVPTEADLAFYVPEGGLHGMGRALEGHIGYWRRQRVLAQKRVEPTREDLANRLLEWLSLDGTIESELGFGLVVLGTQGRGEAFERSRRMIMGGLAMSLYLRREATRSDAVVNIRTATMREALTLDVTHTLYDINHEMGQRAWPEEPRVHLRLADGAPVEGLLEEPETYYVDTPLLVRRHYPGQATPSAIQGVQQRGMGEFDPAAHITIFPHIAAFGSPFRDAPGA